jgi:TRAP-type C4-dicarboxylate transport system permease small subunit
MPAAHTGDGRVKRFLQELDRNAERYLMFVSYAFVCAVIIQEVGRRYLLNYSSAWAEETARYAFIYLGWIGAAYAVRERAHIRFDIVLHRLPAGLHGYLYVFAELATLVFALIALRFSLHTIDQLLTFGATTFVLRVNKLWAEAAVPIGFTLIAIRCVQAIIRDVSDIRAGVPAYQGKSLFEE